MSKLHDLLKEKKIPQFLDYLLQSTPKEVNESNKEGKTLLQIVLTNDFNEEEQLMLLDSLFLHQADPNLGCGDNTTPLYIAVFNGRPLVVKKLLDAGADLTKPSKTKVKSPLFDSKGQPISENNRREYLVDIYPLHVAIEHERGPVIKVIKHKAEELGITEKLKFQLDILDHHLESVLHRVIKSQSRFCHETVKNLLGKPWEVTVNTFNDNLSTPLLAAVEKLDVETVRMLVNVEGIKLDSVNAHNETALHLAFKSRKFGDPQNNRKFIEIAKLLVEAGASLYPYMIIAPLIEKGNILSQRKRDSILRDDTGRTPEDYFDIFNRENQQQRQETGPHYNPKEFEELRRIVEKNAKAKTDADTKAKQQSSQPDVIATEKPAAAAPLPPLPKMTPPHKSTAKSTATEFTRGYVGRTTDAIGIQSDPRDPVPQMVVNTPGDVLPRPRVVTQPKQPPTEDVDLQAALAASYKTLTAKTPLLSQSFVPAAAAEPPAQNNRFIAAMSEEEALEKALKESLDPQYFPRP